MLKLVTGSPGDGKTSNELWDFLNNPAYNGRPKFCTPVNGFEPHKHGVVPIEHISVWEELPEGAVIFCDEVQDFVGTDLSQTKPPEWVKQLARHRHRGFDFIFTTQSPMFLHPFVRKLAKPHVHYTRPWNMACFRFEWNSVQGDPEAKSAKKAATRSKVTTNPEVFKLYTSTVLDTHKPRPPWKIIIGFSLAVLLLVACTWFAVHRLTHGTATHTADAASAAANPAGAAASGAKGTAQSIAPNVVKAPVWTQESMTPRVKGLAYTAPVYDSLTAPTDFPRTAACLERVDPHDCKCYTQQGTPMDVPMGACLVYVHNGAFDPWLTGRRQAAQQQQQQQATIGSDTPDKPVSSPAAVVAMADATEPQPDSGPVVSTYRAHVKPKAVPEVTTR